MNYISILRGINVGGQKKIRMADLKSLYESLGFENVVTYIQSGNVIFDAKVRSMARSKTTVETAIEEYYGFHVPVEIRTRGDIEKIIHNLPFEVVDFEENGTKILVTFLSSKPSAEKLTSIQPYVKAPEELVVIGTEVYLYCPNGYGKTKLSNTFLEKKLGVEATTRNWKTVQKLYELSV